jgi:zinc D-Ala-D-Ala dipeptidase
MTGPPRAAGQMKWLLDCDAIAVPAQPGQPALPYPGQARPDVPVKENDEPLVPLATAIKTYPVYSWLGFRYYPGEMRLRAGVLARIERASRRLPQDFEIVVIDAHRTRAFQAELLAYYQATTASLGDYVADPWSDAPVPPHTTGGAVDLTLSWRGAVLGLGSDFDAFVPDSAPTALEDQVGRTARDLRRLLARILRDEGMTVFGSEWWHWSYGDQYWAAQTGEPVAIYGEIT